MSDRYDLLRLDRDLCFMFYVGSRALMREYREFLDPLGLTYPQYLVLLVLFENDRLTVSEIGSKLMLDTGTLTPLLRRLQVMGIVKRIRNSRDERRVHIHLTENGGALRQPFLKASFGVDSKVGLADAEVHDMRNLIVSVIEKAAGAT